MNATQCAQTSEALAGIVSTSEGKDADLDESHDPVPLRNLVMRFTLPPNYLSL